MTHRTWMIIFSSVAFFFLSGPPFADSETTGESSDPSDASIIDQSVISGFEPKRVLMLREAGLADVRQQPGAAVLRGTAPGDDQNKMQLLVGAELPTSPDLLRNKHIYFTFFLVGFNEQFAATPVAFWNNAQFKGNRIQLSEMMQQQADLSLELDGKLAELNSLESELAELRNRASKIAGVDDIIEVKMKLLRAKGFGEDYAAEKERLQKLVELGRGLEEPENGKLRIQELSNQLFEAAKATAMTDRLNARRREAARTSLEQKIALVQEMRSVDASALAREVLRLREERRKLERAVAPSAVSDSDF